MINEIGISKLFSCGRTFSAHPARDCAFRSNLANVSEIGHLYDSLNEMEMHWTENIYIPNDFTCDDQTVLTHSRRKRAVILLNHDNNHRYCPEL